MKIPRVLPAAKRRAWFALPALFTILAGCSNNPYPAGQTAHQVLYLTFGDVASFDPTVSYNTGDGVIMDQIYPSYYRFHYLKRPAPLELNMGASEPEIKKLPKGYEDWTFHLRHDIVFQNDPCFPGGKGRQVTAKDFVYAFKRMADPALECPVSSWVSDKILGFDAYSKAFEKDKGKNYDKEIPGVELDPKDPYAFTVHLNTSYPQMRYLMAMHFITAIPREAVEKYGDDAFGTSHLVGCGAYRVEEYIPGQRLVLTRNENNHFEHYPTEKDPNDPPEMLQDAGKPLPVTEKVVYTHNTEPLSAYNLFQQGYLDTAGASFASIQVMPAAAALTPEMKAKGVVLHKGVQSAIDDLAFNMKDPVFGGYSEKQRKLRQAISLSLDANAYVDIIDQGMGQTAEFILPPGVDGYDPTYRNPYRRYDPSLKRAKELLKEAGYENGIDPKTHERLTLKFDNFATTPALRQMVRLFINQIQALGIRVDSRESDYTTFTAHVKAGEYQFLFSNWVADYPDSENFLMLNYGPNASPGPNDSNYNNPEYNRLYEQTRTMVPGPDREALIRKMRDISVEDCPRIYLTHMESRALVQPWIRNQKVVALGNEVHQYYGVDPAKRAQLQKEWNGSSPLPLLGFAAVGAVAVAPAVFAVSKRRNRKVRKENAS